MFVYYSCHGNVLVVVAGAADVVVLVMGKVEVILGYIVFVSDGGQSAMDIL